MTLSRRQILIVAAAMLAEAYPPAGADNQFVIKRYNADPLPAAPMGNLGRSKHGFQQSWRPGKKRGRR